jgi:hypothetical protein
MKSLLFNNAVLVTVFAAATCLFVMASFGILWSESDGPGPGPAPVLGGIELVAPTPPTGPACASNGLTPINEQAFEGAHPWCVEQLRRSPPGTRVPLFPPGDMRQQWYGITVDHRGVGFFPNGQPVPETWVHAGWQSIAAAGRLSDTITQNGNEFLAIQKASADYREAVESRAAHEFSDAIRGVGHFVFHGEEYEVDSRYTYAVGPDDKIYRADGPGCFNSNYRIIRLR